MRISATGQVTIPRAIREKLGLLPETEVYFEIVGDAVQLRPASEDSTRGERIVGGLAGRASTSMSTDEILALTRGERKALAPLP